MTAQDILRVAVTVAVAQAFCDWMAIYTVYQKEPYRRAVVALERATAKYDKLAKEVASKTGKQQDKVKKRMDLAKDDVGEARAEVTRRHGYPGILASVLFLVLFRILGADRSGKIMGIFPFVPWSLIRKVSMRGLDFGDDLGVSLLKDSVGVHSAHQSCSFALIFLLTSFSVKFYVHKLVAEPPPPGADQGLLGVLESPKIANSMRQLGLDPDEFKKQN